MLCTDDDNARRLTGNGKNVKSESARASLAALAVRMTGWRLARGVRRPPGQSPPSLPRAAPAPAPIVLRALCTAAASTWSEITWASRERCQDASDPGHASRTRFIDAARDNANRLYDT